MKRIKVNRKSSRSSDNKDDRAFNVYLLSHRKYKYWISAYYILSLIVFLLLTKYTSWDVLKSFPFSHKVNEFIEFMRQNTSVPPDTKADNIINRQLKFIVPTNSWRNIEKEVDKYLDGVQNLLMGLNTKFDSVYTDSIREILEKDKIIIYKNIAIRDSLISHRKELNVALTSDVRNSVKKEKEHFLNNTDSVLTYNHKWFLSREFKEQLYNLFGIKESELKFSISDYLDQDKIYQEKKSELQNFLNNENITANIANISTQNKYILLVSHPLLLIILVYCILLFFHYKLIEIRLIKLKVDSLEFVPIISNILSSYNLYIRIFRWFGFAVDLILPIGVILYLYSRLRFIFNLFKVQNFYDLLLIVSVGFILVLFVKRRHLIKELV